MPIDPQPIVRLLDRIDHHPRLETLCTEFDNAVAKAFRRDVRSFSWLLKSCPEVMSAADVRASLLELRKRYLVVPSEFQGLIDRALGELDRLPTTGPLHARQSSSPDAEELLDFAH